METSSDSCTCTSYAVKERGSKHGYVEVELTRSCLKSIPVRHEHNGLQTPTFAAMAGLRYDEPHDTRATVAER
jgi:hypothetical protein